MIKYLKVTDNLREISEKGRILKQMTQTEGWKIFEEMILDKIGKVKDNLLMTEDLSNPSVIEIQIKAKAWSESLAVVKNMINQGSKASEKLSQLAKIKDKWRFKK